MKHTLHLLDQRTGGATVCPSEVARALAMRDMGADWRALMPIVHDAVDQLLAERRVRLSWKGRRLERRDGPYRIAQAQEAELGSVGLERK